MRRWKGAVRRLEWTFWSSPPVETVGMQSCVPTAAAGFTGVCYSTQCSCPLLHDAEAFMAPSGVEAGVNFEL